MSIAMSMLTTTNKSTPAVIADRIRAEHEAAQQHEVGA